LDFVPRVTVVIPVKDDLAGLNLALACLSEQDYALDRFDVVVADSGSDPPLVVTPPPTLDVRVVRVDHAGSYLARNRALAETTAPVLAFTDADCLPAPGWLRSAVTRLEATDAIVTGPIEVFARVATRPRPAEAWELVHAFPQQRYVADGWAATANMVTTRAVFDRVGLFDETLHSGGDREWGRRATSTGVRITYCPDIRVRHPARRTLRELLTKIERVHRGAVAVQPSAAVRPSGVDLLRSLAPPVGSVRRGWRDPRFPDVRSRLAYTAGEVFVRYGTLAVRLRGSRAARGRKP
jgi:glycosyltransferase involved in cell wall biosynthesis